MRVIYSILVVFLLFTSCTKDFEDLNENPNEPTTANVDHLFTETIIIGAGQFNTITHTEHWTLAMWMQQVADINGITSASNPYPLSGDWNDELWKQWYAEALPPANEIVRLTEGDEDLINKNAIARIWRAFLFHRITDLWGDVPYSEALMGFNEDGSPVLQPGYDAQRDIYLDLLSELQAAEAALDNSKPSFGSSDVVYAGDVESWRKFANSLRLRMAMRISVVDPAVAQEHLNDLFVKDNFISSNGESAHIQYDDTDRHPFYELHVSGQGLRNPSFFLTSLLRDLDDPRDVNYSQIAPFATLFGGYPFQGVPNLLTSAELNDEGFDAFTTSEVGEYFLNENNHGTIMGYAEVNFLLSEAALNGFGAPFTAQTYYDAGVTAAMDAQQISSDSISYYLANSGAFDGTLESIITQKWISLVYNNSYEAYAEYRRTGYPSLVDHLGSNIDEGRVPKRFSYPPSEITLNSDNVMNVGVGINDNSTPVWWDE